MKNRIPAMTPKSCIGGFEMRLRTARHERHDRRDLQYAERVWGVWGGEFINYNLLIENGE